MKNLEEKNQDKKIFQTIKRKVKDVKKDWLIYEKECADQGFKFVCGVDEAGRGPLAGPVCAAAVILKPYDIIEGVDDSKKLSEKKRECLYDIIKKRAISYAVSFAKVEEIEKVNILNATHLAMKRAVDKLNIKPDMVLVDGNSLPYFGISSRAVIKGDSLSESIACASILAKVSRDRYMKEISKEYPVYEFERHKGYGTKLHIEKLKEFGMSPIHRKSFLKKILGDGKIVNG